ncbi:hypothetical protein AMATHDRAFT_54224 [Amanita thiersii Skay4041]|uniref:Rho-GAP domain-containing protein n=1 Tax=Amanita thiersii Skay4041 TaxID=703135 RepID=A0A2A9NYV1_9AGAR|nr:hypothetical protein AMATHDRAFT_54224 [Amanita thiersii Skay4041]
MSAGTTAQDMSSSVGRESPAGSIFISTPSTPPGSSSKPQSHPGHATSASLSTLTDPVNAMPSRRFSLSSSNTLPQSINTPFPLLLDQSPAQIQPPPPSPLISTPTVQSAVFPPFVPNKPSSASSRALAISIPRSSSLPFAFMGQGQSRSSSTTPGSAAVALASPSSVSRGLQAALAGGSRLKRVLANRRKKSEDISHNFGSQSKRGCQPDIKESSSSQGQEHGSQFRVDPYFPITSSASLPSRGRKGSSAVTHATSSMGAEVITPLPITPPLPPPKPQQTSQPQQPAPLSEVANKEKLMSPPPFPMLEQVPQRVQSLPCNTNVDARLSTIPISPGMISAVNFLHMSDGQKEQGLLGADLKVNSEDRENTLDKDRPREKPREADPAKLENVVAADVKEAWRKSDSSMSYQTIRPGTTSNRTSRPVSMAESLQSNHTVKPVRLSALITDADFGMLEEDDDTFKTTADDAVSPLASPPSARTPPPPTTPSPPSHQASSSPTASLKAKSRRSLSLNLGPYTFSKSHPSPPATHHPAMSVTELKQPSISMSEGVPPQWPPTTPSAIPTLVQTSESGSVRQVHSPAERKLPAIPPQATPSTPSTPPHLSQSFRAISMTSSLAPAAERAWRAVNRVGRAIGISSSSSNSASLSGYSSSASTGPSSSDGQTLTRTNSNQSSGASHPHLPIVTRGKRRTPNAPSGAWSVASSMTSGSVSDVDPMSVPPGPVLGNMLRGAMKQSGTVFGRDLKAAVRETAIGAPHTSFEGRRAGEWERVNRRGNLSGKRAEKPLEERALPAVVVRSAQHLLLWGVQEEGLFRVGGRAKHISTLRSEFDRGADYDMMISEPGDLDPHAVASLFKSYFRELPEHMLTAALLPYFEAVVEREMAIISGEAGSAGRSGAKAPIVGPSLPSGPKSGNIPAPPLKKAPSLTTLAMPSFKGMPPPSNSLVRALRSLVSQLPEENRDLLHTLIEVMNATAKNEKATKMPLGNLLLVICPTVQMTPLLLRALCESPGIWDEEELPVLDIKRASKHSVLDISRPKSDVSGIYSDALEVLDEHHSISGSARTSEDHPPSASDYHASAEASIDLREEVGRRRPSGTVRNPTNTVYLDAESGYSSGSLVPKTARHARSRDDISLVSDRSQNVLSPSSSPPLSSSAESLPTPTSSAGQPSIQHLPMDGGFGSRKMEAEPLEEVTEGFRFSEGAVTGPAKLVISNPISTTVQFPSSPSSLPSTPLKRRSIPLLSLPNFSPMVMPTSAFSPPSPSESSQSSQSPRHRKLKKPSLQLLFSKRSNSSFEGNVRPTISGPITNDDVIYVPAPQSASDSSASTPQSAVTAPQGSMYVLPPVLNTPIENSPLSLGMSLQITPPDTATLGIENHYKDDNDRQDSLVIEEAIKSGKTPIADRYCPSPASSSLLSLNSPSVISANTYHSGHLRLIPKQRPRGISSSSNSSSNHIGLLDEDLDSEEDWTRSVLMAADIKAKWLQDGKQR